MMADLDRTEKETQREIGHESKRIERVRAGNSLLLEFSLEVGDWPRVKAGFGGGVIRAVSSEWRYRMFASEFPLCPREAEEAWPHF